MDTPFRHEPASRLEASLRAGRFAGAAQFFLGAADLPIDPPAGWRPDRLAAKVAAGAQFAQTQFCMDAGLVRRYARRLAESAQLGGLYLLVGIAPLRWQNRRAGCAITCPAPSSPRRSSPGSKRQQCPAAEGRRICLELIEELATVDGVAGVHVMAPANEAAVPDVIAEPRKRLPAARQSALAWAPNS
jgi:methylenetetrahydrofolate reductase (NADPH)